MTVLTVSQLNFYIKTLFDSDKNLRSVYLRGEISNFTDHYSSGHLYLSLKEEKTVIKAVMFSDFAKRLSFRPENGMTVIVRGRVSTYTQTGQYQFYIEEMQPDGAGTLSIAFEQLKKKLEAEGLFADEHKKPLPLFPERIGVITSPTGAAVQDILRILGRRYPYAEVVFCPVLVQGEGAAQSLTEAIRRFDSGDLCDVIIIGRGGGSVEDLWAFNDESLARAIYDCHIPVVSGVGHETDFTICDFVSDLRASTPSAAAERVSPEAGEPERLVKAYQQLLTDLLNDRIDNEKNKLEMISKALAYHSPLETIHNRQLRLDSISSRLNAAYSFSVERNRSKLSNCASRLDALSPLRVLSRGYALITDKNGCITSVNDTEIGETIDLTLSDGKLGCLIERKISDNE